MVDQMTWNDLTSFPDLVAVQTSSMCGTKLRELHNLRLSALVACNDPKQPFLGLTLMSADEDFNAAIFNLLHGFYRQSFYSLRSALDLTLTGVFLELDQTTDVRDIRTGKSLREGWIKGEEAIKFKTACDGLIKYPVIFDFEGHLKNKQTNGFFAQTHDRRSDGWLWQLCHKLSKYAHTRRGYTNGDMWNGIGPVYNADAFDQFVACYFEVLLICTLLVKMAKKDLALAVPFDALVANKTVLQIPVAVASIECLFGEEVLVSFSTHG